MTIFFVTVANKGTKTDSDYHQPIGILCETLSLLKDELRNKQVTIDNLIDVTKSFTKSKINIQEIKNKKET